MPISITVMYELLQAKQL